MKKFVILAVLASVILATSSNASTQLYYRSSCGRYFAYPGHGSYGQLYYYSGGYYYPYKEERVILVPKAIRVEVQRDHYYSLDQSLLADAIVGRLLRLQSGSLRAQSPEPKVQLKSGSKVGAGAYQDEKLVGVVKTNCAKCHGHDSKHTRLLTEDGKLADISAGKAWECFGLVNTGEMPRGGKALSNDDAVLFYQWAKNAKR